MRPNPSLRLRNPFLCGAVGAAVQSGPISLKLTSICAIGVISSLSMVLGQELPVVTEDPALDSGAVVPATLEPLVQNLPSVVGEDPQMATAQGAGVVEPFETPAMVPAEPEPSFYEEVSPAEPVDSVGFFGPGDFDPVFGISPVVTGGWGGFSDPNRGFSSGFGGFPVGANPYYRLLDGLSMSATLSGVYNSNPSMGYAAPSDDGDGDFSMTLGGSIGYQTVGGEWTFGGRYSGSYTEYFSQSNLSGFGQSASVFAAYQGGPLTVTTTLGINFASGANRYYESVVDELSLSLEISARYQYSAVTAFEGYASTGFVMPGGSRFENTDSYSFGASMLWRYSPLLEFGPGIAVGVNSGDFQERRVSYGPTLTVNYKATDLISLSGRIGLDFVDYEDSGTEGPNFSYSIIANYRSSPIWGMSLALGQGTQVDPSQAGGFTQTTFVSLNYNRSLPWASWNIGVSFEHMDEEMPSRTLNVPTRDRDYFSINSSLSMPIFADTCTGSLFVQYSEQSSSVNSGSWDSFSAGFSISRQF